jgi:hypothetical protein
MSIVFYNKIDDIHFALSLELSALSIEFYPVSLLASLL